MKMLDTMPKLIALQCVEIFQITSHTRYKIVVGPMREKSNLDCRMKTKMSEIHVEIYGI